jgi:beta-N-acetylhexosaminidase
MKKKAIIISVSGTKLTTKEKNLIQKEFPWGLILFKRNIQSIGQLKSLIKDIKFAAKDKNFPILIDEEGGAVTRLSKIFDNKAYSQKFFGDLFMKNKKLCLSLYESYIFSICSVLKSLGININTVPVLDILKKQTHKIINTRSYSANKRIIKLLGKICVETYKVNKIGTVIKHIPGHGSSKSDSHYKLPVVKNLYKDLIKTDFNCFKGIDSHFAMTAHIVYSKIDKLNTCTHSKKVIKDQIRKKIKFKGILISDDISMKALKFDLVKNAKKSLEAGCNLVLYCTGKYEESLKLLRHMPYIDSFTAKKTSEFYKFLR